MQDHFPVSGSNGQSALTSLTVTVKDTGCFCHGLVVHLGFPSGPEVKESAYNAGELGSIPGL